MPIQFANTTIPGIVLAPGPLQDEPRVLMREIPRWGVRGLEVLTSHVGDSTISVLIVLTGFATEQELASKLNELRRAAGTSGQLVFQSDKRPNHRFGDCIFLGPRTLPGDDNGPVEDTCGKLKWWQIVQLSWRQTNADGE